MSTVEDGIFALADVLVISKQYTFTDFKITKYYENQNPKRIILLNLQFVFNNHNFYVSLLFKNMKIYMLSLVACDINFKNEEERKNYPDEILKELVIRSNATFNWGSICSVYDKKSNISSIDVIFISG